MSSCFSHIYAGGLYSPSNLNSNRSREIQAEGRKSTCSVSTPAVGLGHWYWSRDLVEIGGHGSTVIRHTGASEKQKHGVCASSREADSKHVELCRW